jgi:hypothetical protein
MEALFETEDKVLHTVCWDHTGQLWIGGVFKDVPGFKGMMDAVRALVIFVGSSSLRVQNLRTRGKVHQAANPGFSCVMLYRPPDHRWNTEHMMLQQVKRMWSVIEMLTDADVNAKSLSERDDWTAKREAVRKQCARIDAWLPVLEVLGQRTGGLSADKVPTISKVLPAIRSVRSVMRRQISTCPKHADELETGLGLFEERFAGWEDNQLLQLAEALDPSTACKIHAATIEERVAVLEGDASWLPHSVWAHAGAGGVPESKDDDDDAMVNVHAVAAAMEAAAGATPVRQEVRRFVTELVHVAAPSSLDVVQWWNERQDKLPLLYRVARNVLSFPATSAPAERLFSLMNRIVTERHSRACGSGQAQVRRAS